MTWGSGTDSFGTGFSGFLISFVTIRSTILSGPGTSTIFSTSTTFSLTWLST